MDDKGFHPIAPWRPNDYTKPRKGPELLVLKLNPNFVWFDEYSGKPIPR